MNKNEDFGKYLQLTYPCLFSKQMYVECGPGWYDLIDELAKKIGAYCETISVKYSEKPLMEVVQIKEKFGGLRFYIDYFIDREDLTPVEMIIHEYEKRSYRTCEDCGADAIKCAPKGYWIKTLCYKCCDKYDMGDTPNGI